MKPLQAIELSETSVEYEQLDFGSVLTSSDVDAASQDSTAPLNECGRIQKSMLAVRQAIFAASGLPGLQSAMASHLQQHCHAVQLCWHTPAGTQIGQTERLEGLLSPAEGISAVLRDHLKQAAKQCTLRNEICSFAMSSKLRLFALPVPSFTGHSLLLVSENQTTPEALMAHVTAHLLMLSSFTAEWAMRRAGLQSADNARTVAAMIELVAHVHSAADVNSACQRLVDSLQHYLKAERVVVGLCRRGASEVRVAAFSGGMVVDRFSEETRLVESVLQESLVRSACGVWPVLDPVNRHALLSHQQLAESGFGKSLISVPIRAESGEAVGSLLVVLAADDSAAVSTDRVRDAECFLRAGAGAIAGCLSVLQKLADSRILRLIHAARAALSTSRLHMAAWIMAALTLVLLVPVTYRVSCSAELQPVHRNYVATPFDGMLEECLVEPGDIVVRDQLLARMDGREIRWELAEVQANLNKATKERNTQLSKKEFGNAAISGHEIQRLEQRAALLAYRSASLEIRSPADGVVVSGDHREAEGVPLEMGKTLFEIAPLDAMVVEIGVPEEDVRHVTAGMTVDIQLEAVPEEKVQAVIRSVHPRAELLDGENVFVAEADIPNNNAILRPGMRGLADVRTRRHPLGWNLFHKPAAWLLGWLGW